MYVIEHAIPAKEGGIVEYLGSKQTTYQLKGILAADATGFAGAVLSGTAYYGVNADDAQSYLKAIRGSGAQLLVLESTWSNLSGYPVLYENGFFQIEKETFGFEGGHGYPYYPFTLDLRGATPATYGNSSGTQTFPYNSGVYFSGWAYYWRLSGTQKGERINSLGVFVNSVASGHLQVAVYSGGNPNTATLVGQSASQPVRSGWNWFPINPGFKASSGLWLFGLMGDASNASGFTVAMFDNLSGISTGDVPDESQQINAPYLSGFPSTPSVSGYINISGVQFNQTMVTG